MTDASQEEQHWVVHGEDLVPWWAVICPDLPHCWLQAVNQFCLSIISSGGVRGSNKQRCYCTTVSHLQVQQTVLITL